MKAIINYSRGLGFISLISVLIFTPSCSSKENDNIRCRYEALIFPINSLFKYKIIIDNESGAPAGYIYKAENDNDFKLDEERKINPDNYRKFCIEQNRSLKLRKTIGIDGPDMEILFRYNGANGKYSSMGGAIYLDTVAASRKLKIFLNQSGFTHLPAQPDWSNKQLSNGY